jgi:hypothetical protein
MYSLEDLEAFCARFYQGFDLLITPYGYNTTWTAIAAAAQQTQNVSIAANADFIMLGLRHHFGVADTVAYSVSSKPAPFLRLLITDTGSAEQFTAQAVDLENYSTNGVGERALPYPRIVAGRTALQMTLTNWAPAAETYTGDIFLNGVLVRAYGGGTGPRGALSIPAPV